MSEISGERSLYSKLYQKATQIPRVFPSGGDWGISHELYVTPHNSCVPPQNLKIIPPPIFVDDDKNFLDIFSIFVWHGLFNKHNKFKDANFTVLIEILKQQ